MNETEKRRRELLLQARNLYQDTGTFPAVHPRYRAAYQSIYGTQDSVIGNGRGTFGIRTVICVLLFAAFLVTDYKKIELWNMDSSEITAMITAQPEEISESVTKIKQIVNFL